MAHSPAPWRVEGSVRHGDLSGKTISFGLNAHGDGPAGYVMRAMEISEKDLALVLAAPKMLAALKALNESILGTAESNASGNPNWEYVSARVNAARLAIAMAEPL